MQCVPLVFHTQCIYSVHTHILLLCSLLYCNSVFIISLHLAPSQPAINGITPSTTTLTVRWDKEFNYRLHVQKKDSTEINTFGPVTPPYNITGLESNTEYTVVVEAYSPLGSVNGSVVGYTLPEGEDNLNTSCNY